MGQGLELKEEGGREGGRGRESGRDAGERERESESNEGQSSPWLQVAGSPLPPLSNPFSTHSSSHSSPPCMHTHTPYFLFFTSTHTRRHTPSCFVAVNLHEEPSSNRPLPQVHTGTPVREPSCKHLWNKEDSCSWGEGWGSGGRAIGSGLGSDIRSHLRRTKWLRNRRGKKMAGISHQVGDKKWKRAQDPSGKYPLNTKETHPALTSPSNPPPSPTESFTHSF